MISKMKTVTNTDDLFNFKENIIFEEFKDKSFASIKQFRFLVFHKYKHVASSGLYQKVINYQIKTYGDVLNNKLPRYSSEGGKKLANLSRNRKYYRRKKGSK